VPHKVNGANRQNSFVLDGREEADYQLFCFHATSRDVRLFTLLHIAGIALESEVANDPAPAPPTISTHVYKIRPRADKRGVNLISDALRYSPLWYAGPNAVSNAISFAKSNSRPLDAVIRVYDEAGNVIETHEHAGEFKEW